ncbi:MAG: YggS family pyridoxal phosphate-dependent enzyme [Hydrogenophilaceae bacterium]|nr:YggS family pyridoxal phosphate-dependent enzyme [Hydrogenophilaceae bacterium]
MGAIAKAMQDVHRRIAAAVSAAQRLPDSVHLLAVSKTFPAAAVIEAYRAGQTAFGESYVQEAVEKIAEVHALLASGIEPATNNHSAGVASPSGPLLRPLEWHFIGPIQSNKTRPIAEQFDWVHSVDRLKIAERLAQARPAGRPPLNVCVQVNIGDEQSKGGVPPSEALSLARQIAALPGLKLRGFMTIPRPTDDVAGQRAQFRQLHELFDRARAEGLAVDTLSMGMSDDLEAAIMEGATIVRIGSAIFGARGKTKEGLI